MSSCTISRETKDMLCALLSEKTSERIKKPKDLLNMMQNCLLSLEIFDATKLKDDSTNISDLNFQTQKMDPQKSFRELPQIGQEIGNCVLKELIGQGGFGYVYKAFHQILKIDLAIKILDPRTRNNDPTSVAMFLREARIAASISHPNIINTFEAGKDKGYHYIIMEYMNGGNLKDHMEKVGLSYNCLGKILLELSKGLSATEKLNIVHRDIKPANIMFSSNDSGCSIKIADMGLAKRLDLANEDNQITQNLSSQPINGSPAYMAPEMVLTPELVDSRDDIYSLGATAYHAIAGEPMFKGKNARDTIMSHVQDQPKLLSEFKKDIPQQLENIIMKMLEKKPADRHQSSKELTAEIESFIKNSQKNWSIKKLFNMALVKLI